MRILFTSIPARTHVHSMIPLAWAARVAGHAVCIAVGPSLVDYVAGTGLPVVAIGEEAVVELPTSAQSARTPFGNLDFEKFNADDVVTNELIAMFTVMVPSYFAPVNDVMLTPLTAWARSWRPDLVIWEPMTWAGAIAARGCGARHARLQWGPDVLGDAILRLDTRLAELPPAHREDPLREWLYWSADRVGAAVEDADVLGEWTIEVESELFRLPTGLDTVEAGYVPFNGPAVIPEWVATPSARPRVCVTLGISSREARNVDAIDPIELVRALGRLDADFIVTLSEEQQRELGGAWPPNVRVVDFVALDVLLSSCAAIIHHGGAGTWSTALRHAVPQVIVGHTWDAPLKARMLHKTGGGIALPSGAGAEEIVEALRQVLASHVFRERARELAREVRSMPTPADAITELVARINPRPREYLDRERTRDV